MLLNVGPAHPAMHGIIRIVATLDGEKIVDADVEIGYLHRGFEKMSETVDYNGVIPYSDRLNYVSPLINNMGYCMAVEKLLGLSMPGALPLHPSDHVGDLPDHGPPHMRGRQCHGAGSVYGLSSMIKAREFLWELVEMVTGARLTVSYCRVGGVKGDLPDGFPEQCGKALQETRKVLAESDGLLTRNRIFVDRMSGVGMISAEDAISHGITGPFLRERVDHDVRRIVPMPSTIDSSSTCRLGHGDNFDRFLVRMEEMRQSIRIIEQALRDIPPGPVLTDPETGRSIAAAAMVDQAKAGEITAIADARAVADPTLDGSARPLQSSIAAGEKRVLLPAKEDTYGNIEGLMRHFKLVM